MDEITKHFLKFSLKFVLILWFIKIIRKAKNIDVINHNQLYSANLFCKWCPHIGNITIIDISVIAIKVQKTYVKNFGRHQTNFWNLLCFVLIFDILTYTYEWSINFCYN